MSILRIILGVVLGAALGLGVVMAGDVLNHLVFPPTTLEKFVADVRAVPAHKLAALPVAYALAAFVAAFAGAKIAARVWAGWIAGGLLTAATFANLVMIAHPLWFTAACVVLAPTAAWLGAHLAARRAAAVA
ncbi:MAG TPA: hypothetical protein VEA80_06155 [Vitreimonas sp.]|uniref:hypothetical protein n=1 Tax=Vitreimonas sp. TaxID=3069702 RepID=UPI002D751BBE|nr:hypothetical protein [Vitreimonas sp.]HYD87036.1 hypothetical protein [Vitreimonas sp.]